MNDVYDMYFRTSNRIKAKIVVYNQHPISSTDGFSNREAVSPLWENLPDGAKLPGILSVITLSCPWTYFRSMNQGNLTQFISCLSQEDDPIPPA